MILEAPSENEIPQTGIMTDGHGKKRTSAMPQIDAADIEKAFQEIQMRDKTD